MPDFIFASQADIEAVEGEVSALEQNKQDLTEKVSAIEEADKANTDKYTSVKAVVDYVEPLKNSVSNGKSLVASAITNKGVITAADASFDTMATNINSIKLGSGNATADKVLNPYTFTNSTGEEQTGTIPSKAAATITPGTTNKTISAGQYLSGTQTIAGDANLVAANIKSGVSIFGVTGTVEDMASIFDNVKAIEEYSPNSYGGTSDNKQIQVPTRFQKAICIYSHNENDGGYDWMVFPFKGIFYYRKSEYGSTSTYTKVFSNKTSFTVPTSASGVNIINDSIGYLRLVYSGSGSNIYLSNIYTDNPIDMVYIR